MTVIWVAVAAVYLAGWWWGAKTCARREYARCASDYPGLMRTESDRQSQRAEALGVGLLVGAFWPGYWAWLRLTSDDRLYRIIPPSDDELRRLIAERDARIADLEREAGL